MFEILKLFKYERQQCTYEDSCHQKEGRNKHRIEQIL